MVNVICAPYWFTRLVLVVSLFSAGWTYGQTNLSGKVSSHKGELLGFASVTIEGINKGVIGDANGTYSIVNVPAGTYQVSAVIVGYKRQTKQVTISNSKNVKVNFALEEDVQALEEVTVSAEKHAVQKIKEQSFTVSSIDVAPLQNLNIDVNTVLNRSTGVRIRQGGGLGSDFSFSLNGFSGNQVRFFIDGISSDYLGSAMRFNNIPVNVIERIEVYKGVVPIHLGADALGGAVNIVTSDNAKDFLDVSYSNGSFNTHQAAIASRMSIKDQFVVNVSGFYNYSDNDFKVDAQLVDQNSGKISEPKPLRLFNEQYRSSSAVIEGGVVRTKWADRFLVGLIASENKKNRQRGRAMVLNPSGEVYTTDHGLTPTLKYQKKDLGIKNLSLNLSTIYSYTQTMNVDTSSRIYSWDGSYVMREFGTTSGELSWYKTMFRFNDKASFTTATLSYLLGEHHTFSLNNTYSNFSREGSDPVTSQYNTNIAFADPNTLRKNVTGFSYNLGLFDDRWNTVVFFKLFNMHANVQEQDEDTGEYNFTTNESLENGKGLATSLFVTKSLLLKSSYEHTSRLPENYELFGDGLLLLPNVALQPERSHNINFDVLYSRRIGDKHLVNVEGGFIYRLPENMIRLVAIGVLSQYQNLNSAQVMGGEGSIRYSYDRRFNLELNATYQDMRNNNKIIESYPDPLYMDRVPNIPYLFGNAVVGFTSPELGESKVQIGFNWATMFVEEFYLNWPSQGNKDLKYQIPQQLSHDASITLSSMSGRYNLSFSCWNLADSKLYDNFKVQKPGRSFNVKLRFYIEKFKD